MPLSKQQNQRYLRNLVLKEIGESGQLKLLKAKILIVGAGGLGSPCIFYLAAAGIGNIGIIDHDKVELSNLQRQIIHNQNDLNENKAKSAKQKIKLLDDQINVTTYQEKAQLENLGQIIKNYDLIIDCTDNFQTRKIINQVAFNNQKPLIFAAVKEFQGQLAIFKPYQNHNPCYHCFNNNNYDQDFSLPLSQKGILGAVAGSLGAMQANLAIKEILQIGAINYQQITFIDLLNNNFRSSKLSKNPNCKICK